jgi:hypothetical protein
MNMKIKLSSIIIVVLLALSLSTTALAQGGDPIGGCPDGFHRHHIMDHDNHAGHTHQHVGSAADQNGDDYLCVKHVSVDENIHVHIDNNVPLK